MGATPQIAHTCALGHRAFDASSPGVHLREGLCLLPCPRRLEAGVMVVLSNAECPGMHAQRVCTPLGGCRRHRRAC